MRKRYLFLGAGALAAGLAALGTVAAQSLPGGSSQPKLPATNVRPYSDYPPHGQTAQPRPRLTTPVVAEAEGVRPAGGQLPPPNMEMSTPPATDALPPPSVMMDRVTTPPGIPPLPPGVMPVPPAPENPPVSAPPSTPAILVPPPSGGSSVSPAPLPPLSANAVEGSQPATTPIRPTLAAAGISAKMTQNVTIEAVCPETVEFGAEFRYELIVRNTGTSSVAGVRVDDDIPAGTKYIGSDPPAEISGDRLSWSVGTLDVGGEKRIAVRVKPTDEGEVKSRATVTFVTSIEAKTKVTRPRVAVAVTGSEVCKAGEDASFQLKVTNSGTGPAARMVVQALLSDGLVHPSGSKLEMEMANLAAGETRTVPLRVSASKAGAQWCQITVAAEGCQDSTAKATMNVVEALLQIAQTGPTKCHVRAEPTYEITLSNPGTATTDVVALYAVLPEGFDYVQASDNATFSAANRAVVWKLTGLAPGGTKPVTLKMRAVTAGDGSLRTIAQTVPEQPVVGPAGGSPAKPTARVLEAKTETAIKAEGVAAVRFEVIDLDDPVEVGKEAVYEVRVMNQGTGACTNVQLVAAIAEGTEYKGSSGPTQVKAQGQHLVFEPIATLAAKGEAVYRVKIRGTVAGDLRFRVQLTCDQVRTPVVKEESTRFYKE